MMVSGFKQIQNKSNTKCYIQTNMTDQKKMFNLESHIDYKLNDCRGEMIRVTEVMIKK